MNKWLKRKLIKNKLKNSLETKIGDIRRKLTNDIRDYGNSIRDVCPDEFSPYSLYKLCDRESILLELGFIVNIMEVRNNPRLLKEYDKQISNFYDNYVKYKENYHLERKYYPSISFVKEYEITKLNGETFRVSRNDLLTYNNTWVVWNDETIELFQKIKPIYDKKDMFIEFNYEKYDSYIKRITNIWKKVETW